MKTGLSMLRMVACRLQQLLQNQVTGSTPSTTPKTTATTAAAAAAVVVVAEEAEEATAATAVTAVVVAAAVATEDAEEAEEAAAIAIAVVVQKAAATFKWQRSRRRLRWRRFAHQSIRSLVMGSSSSPRQAKASRPW